MGKFHILQVVLGRSPSWGGNGSGVVNASSWLIFMVLAGIAGAGVGGHGSGGWMTGRAVGADAADAVGRFAIGLGRFHQPIPRDVGVPGHTMIPEVVGLDTGTEVGKRVAYRGT